MSPSASCAVLLRSLIWWCLLTLAVAEFLGGTLAWISAPGNKIRVTYRTAWEKGTGPCGPTCSPVDIGSPVQSLRADLSSLQWTTDSNSTTYTSSNVTYVVTSVSMRSITGWEQSEHVLNFDVPSSQRFTVIFRGFHWVSSLRDFIVSSPGIMITHVDARIRNDTGRPNLSPFSSLPAYFGIALGCERTIRLPVDDPDKDNVRCRLANPAECGNACTNVPQGTLWVNQINCTAIVPAFTAIGYRLGDWYRIALVIEDFPEFNITMGSDIITHNQSLSSVPLQISVHVVNGSCNDYIGLRFVRPTSPNYASSSISTIDVIMKKAILSSFYVEHNGTDELNSTEVMVSGPMYLTYSYSQDDYSRSNVCRVNTSWLVAFPSQFGTFQVCIWIVDFNGVTSDDRCITDIVGDPANNCETGKVDCENNGTCVDIFQAPNEKCLCQPGYRNINCSQEVHCLDTPCENKGICTDTTSGYSCRCPSEYTGRNCEVRIPPCWWQPCRNGATCVNFNSSALCLCSTNFTGNLCEENQTKYSETLTRASKKTTNVWLIVGATVGALVAICVVVVISLVIRLAFRKHAVKPTRSV